MKMWQIISLRVAPTALSMKTASKSEIRRKIERMSQIVLYLYQYKQIKLRSAGMKREKIQEEGAKPNTYQQLIKLTKENQYFRVKAEALHQQLNQVCREKEKYKNKYKCLKSILKRKRPEDPKYPNRVREEQLESEAKEEKEYQLTFEEAHHLKSKSVHESTMNKMHDAVIDLSVKVEKLLEKLDHDYLHPLLTETISRMNELLNSMAYKIKENEGNKKLKLAQYSSIVYHDKVPERDQTKNINNIGRFVESKSQHSLPFRQISPEGNHETAEKHGNWRLLSEISKELKEWKFSLSDEQQY